MTSDNLLRTSLLFGALTFLLVTMGYFLGGTGGLIFMLIFSIIMNGGAWFFSSDLALKMNGAREVSPEEAPELHRMVEELAVNAGLPKPKVCIVDNPVPNAFATGRNPQNAAVAATTGLMDIMNRDELAGVMAHELAHIRNRDTLISTIAATIAGAITSVANIAMWGALFGGFGGNDDDNPGQAIGAILMIVLAPIAAAILQAAISRQREFAADRGGAEIAGNPLYLADALAKLQGWQMRQQGIPQEHQPNPATAHMYIFPIPVSRKLMSTHPDTNDRIRKLREMAGM
jgi:heat shock protein HtpX